ncbi:MAG TPA: SDR family NAD(P)-dependent oxidoreductase, partial [Flavobacterium sp.]|nr:SDR family NAD(P)-dependent oxidoreductase [Flavobacterium sp.]
MATVPFRLDTKNILVTGASSGIGKAIATVAAAQGASVCLTARDTAKLEAAKATLEGDGHQIFSADLGNVADLEALTD